MGAISAIDNISRYNCNSHKSGYGKPSSGTAMRPCENIYKNGKTV
jgi:hypothetical protein